MSSWKQFFENEKHLATLVLAHRIRGVNEVVGSAAYLAPGLFVTAKHVVEKAFIDMGMIRQLSMLDTDTNVTFEVDLLHVLTDKRLLVWRIGKIHMVPNSDLAVLTAQAVDGPLPLEDIDNLPRFTIDLHPPRPATVLSSLGYVGKLDEANVRLEGTQTSHTLAMHEGKGPITALHLFERASSAHPPVIEVPYEILHSMSGGPSFNHLGYITAINSAGLAPEAVGSTERSIVSMLWRAVVASIEVPRESGWERTSILQLNKEGYIQIRGLDHFIFDMPTSSIEWRGNMSCPTCITGSLEQ